MPLEPALVIQRFANRDAVKPSFQRAALAETANAAEGFQENFLSAVSRVRSIAQHPEDKVIDRGMIVGDEPVEMPSPEPACSSWTRLASSWPHERALAHRTLPGLSDPTFLSTYYLDAASGHLLGSTLRTIDPGTTCKPGRRRPLARNRCPLTPVRHRVERSCFPG